MNESSLRLGAATALVPARKENQMRGAIRSLTVIAAVAVGMAAVAGLRPASAHATHGAVRATTIRVSTHNSRYVLSAKTAPRGVVIFKINNPASQPHDFSINGRTSKLLRTGQSTTFRVTFRRSGHYVYRDTFDHHAQFGCRGGFWVT